MADTVPANTGTTAVVAVGGSVTGAIDTSGDQDWYRISLTAGHQYRFDLQGSDSGQGTLADPLLRLINGSGVQLVQDDDSGAGLDSSLTYTPSQSGTYFLSAQAFGSATGSFRLGVTDLSEVPGTTATTAVVAVGGSVAGTIDASGDQDWYRVSLTAGRQYRFDLQALDSGQGTLTDPLLRLLNASGAQLAEDDDSGTGLDSSLTFTPSQSGTYFLSAQAFGSNTGTFRLTATDITAGAADVPGSTSTTAVVAVGGSVAGSIEAAGDTDWYRVTLVAGHQYRFDLEGAPTGQGTLADTWLSLMNGAGTELAYNDNAGGTLNSSITYTATTSGTYFLSAEPFDLDTQTGTYRLSATDITVGAGDVPGTTSTTAVVAVGGSVSGSIEVAGDTDWYRVTLVAGHQYRFDLQGTPTGQGTLADTWLSLRDGAGVQITYNDNAGGTLNSIITYTATVPGTYFLSAEPLDLTTQTGTYRLSVTDLGAAVSVDVPGNSTTTATVAVGGSITGAIDTGGDTDWYRVTLVAGRQYRFDLQGAATGQGTLADPWLSLTDGAGTELAYNDNAGGTLNSSITYTATTSGTYFLSAEPLDLTTQTGTYRLSVTDLGSAGPVDVPGNTTTTSSVVVGGSIVGTINPGGDQDWFRVSLTSGRQYRIDLKGLDSGQGTLTDPLLRLLDGSGLQLTQDDDSGTGLESSLTFTPTQSGTYFLSAQGYQSNTGTFALSVADLGGSGAGGDSVPADIGTSRSVPIGSSVTTTIDAAGDQDWYRVSLTAGRQYRFELRNADSGQGTTGDPVLRLLDSAGLQLSVNDDSGGTRNSSIIFVPTQSGTFFLSAQAFGSTTGTFVLSAADLGTAGPADVPGSTSTTAVIAAGGTVAGSIEAAGDQDWYRVSLTAGRQYRIELEGAPTSQGTLADPQLRLMDPAGTQILVNDNAGGTLNSSITFTAAQSAVHFVSAQGTGASAGTYVLRVADLTGESGADRPINGTEGNDSLESLTGDSFNNRIFGFGGDDALDGKGGDDTLDGGAGNDVMTGGQGNDMLMGGPGNDAFADVSGNNVIDGGSGDDLFNVDVSGSTVTGGLGRDRYNLSPVFFDRNYVVTDFAAGTNGDLLDVRTLLTSSRSVGAYSAGNSNPFASGVLRWVQSGPDALLQWDKDGAAGPLYSPTTQIVLRNVAYTSITSDNFVSDSAQGDKDDNVLLTGPGDDTLNGLEGNDTLDGSLGRDTMAGGPGNDTYYVDNLADVVQEVPNVQLGVQLVAPAALEGFIDTIIAAISFSLGNAANVENLLLAAASAAAVGTGNELDNVLTGNELNNTLTGLGGNDTLDGGAGADTAVYGSPRAAYTINGASPNFTIAGPDGADTLVSIERLQFADRKIAFDLGPGQAAGNTVRVIGAAFNENLIIPDYVGIGLQFFDGGMTMLQVCTQVAQLMALNNTAFVNRVYENVVGSAPGPAALASFVGLLQGSGGQMTQGQLLEVAATVDLNAANINLVGLQQSGVEFV